MFCVVWEAEGRDTEDSEVGLGKFVHEYDATYELMGTLWRVNKI
jgi:hypothetical protein